MIQHFDPYDGATESQRAVLESPWRQVGDRNYPSWYFYSLGRYRASEADVARLRAALSGLPRVDPSAYDILFNALLRTWDVVKWVPTPEPTGHVPGGALVRSVLEPYPVYEINALERDPSTLGELDFERMRKLCSALRGGEVIDAEMDAATAAMLADDERERQDKEHDLAGYYRDAILRESEASGVGELAPEEMARRFGGLAAEWDPDTFDH